MIGQLRVAPEANEITAALELLRTLPLKGVTITGDAIFTQRAICQVIIDGGGDYFFTVKGNQPALKSGYRTGLPAFFSLGHLVRTPDLGRAGTIEKNHGRIETRQIETTAALIPLLAPLWTGVAQVCRITRERIIRDKKTIETVYAIASLTADQVGPAQLLALSRAHSGIEDCALRA